MNLAFWDKQVTRAKNLAGDPATSHLLIFYQDLLGAQRDVYEYFSNHASFSSIQLSNVPELLAEAMPILLRRIERSAPTPLAVEAESFKASSRDEIQKRLAEYVTHRAPTQFFAKALFQPYGFQRWESGATSIVSSKSAAGRCPFCGGAPQVSFLTADGAGEGASRSLICGTCLFSWPFRRGVCVNCGEDRPANLAYFQAKEFAHVRIEVCDSCKSYVKGVDLSIVGIAVPLIEDVATAALDLWALEQGYTKVEINLIGL